MCRRLAAIVLTAAIVLAGIVAGPCMSRASCALAQARQMNCCQGTAPGIGTPRCCQGPRQLGRDATPATVERVVHSPATAVHVFTASLALPLTNPAQGFLLHRSAPGSAPSGGTLVAQHTSLLL